MGKKTVYKGNVINNFGKHLPVPYVERIEIRTLLEEEYEDLKGVFDHDVGWEGISKLTIVTSLLFNTNDGFLLEHFTNHLWDDLNINFISLTNVDQINMLKESKRGLKSFADPHRHGMYKQFRSMPLQDISYSDDVTYTSEYDENNNEVLKASGITYDLYVPSVSGLDDLALFVGVSVGDPYGNLEDLQNVVFALSFSDLAIEMIKKDGQLNVKDKVGYFLNDGSYYPGIPLMDFQAHYRTTDELDQEDIKEKIDSLKEAYATAAISDGELDGVLNSIDYIYSEYGSTPMYLVQLNRFRRNIMNQDLATNAGQFYERYRRMVINAEQALRTYPEVFKRITYSSKIRDYRPSQMGNITPTYHTHPFNLSPEELFNKDLIYKVFLQTNLAKYVPARSDVGEASAFQAETAYTPNEMEAAYEAAVGAKFARFLEDNTSTTREGYKMGIDNMVQWLSVDQNTLIHEMVAEFSDSIQKFQDWATGLGHGAEEGLQMMYYGGPEDSANWLAIARYEQGWDDDIDFEDQRNALAFESAKRFFGWHGNPESNNCTLEFGWDSAKTSDGWRCNLLDEQSSIGWDDGVETDGSTFNQYKCFKQVAGMINVAGYGSTTNTSDDIYGVFLKIRDHRNPYDTDWNLRSADYLAENKIRPALVNYLDVDDGTNNVYLRVQEAFNYLRANWLGGDSEDTATCGAAYQEMIRDESVWNQLVADYGLLTETGHLDETALDDYATDLRDAMDDYIQEYKDTVLGGGRLFKNFRLRWCPDVESTTDIFDPARGEDADPYGGAWSSLAVHREKTGPAGRPYGDAAAASGSKWFYKGGCGNLPGLPDPRRATSLGIGRHEVNVAERIAQPAFDRWDTTWKKSTRDAIKDAIRLIAEYHGLNASKSEHRVLSRVDVITQKYGWFFFDLEKYIQNHSALSLWINPGLFQQYFEWGRDMVNNLVRIEDVTFYRCPTAVKSAIAAATDEYINGYGQTGPHVEMSLNYNTTYASQPTDVQRLKFAGSCGDGGSISAGNAPYAKVKQIDVAGWQDLAVARDGDEVYLKDKATGGAASSYYQYAYLIQRNYDFAYNDKVPNDYRLACFAYNYYIDDDEALKGPDSVGVKVTVRDRSDLIITKYYSYLQDILEGFDEYVAAAEESCAYNSIDEQFNQFFINAMDDQYSDDPTSAPWLRAAAAFALYQDMYHGTHGGEYSIVLEAANSIAAGINPSTGNLQALRDFKSSLDEAVGAMAGRSALIDALGTTSGTGAPPEYTEFIIGHAHNSAEKGRDPIIIDKPIIDYASDDSSWPELPDPDTNDEYTPPEESESTAVVDPSPSSVSEITYMGVSTYWMGTHSEYLGATGLESGKVSTTTPSKEPPGGYTFELPDFYTDE